MYFNDADFKRAIAMLIVFGAVVGAALAFGLPWLWDAIKHWLHWITS